MVDDERMWPPACTAKSEQPFVWANELLDVTFVHSSFDDYIHAVESARSNYLRLQVSLDQSRNRWLGATFANTLHPVFTLNKLSKNSNLVRTSDILVITGGHNHMTSWPMLESLLQMHPW